MKKIFPSLLKGQGFSVKAITVISLILFCYFFVVSSIFITTENMSPNLKKGDIVLSWHFGYKLPFPFMEDRGLKSVLLNRGDIISFRFPGDKEQLIVRRVVALPGDKLKIREGLLFLNDKVVDYRSSDEKQSLERFPGEKDFHIVKFDSEMNLDILPVPEDHIFVLSDHRKSRDDSMDWGVISFKNVESRLGFIWFSVDEKWNPIWSRFFLWIR